MLYRLLGMLVWHGGKVMLRTKYGRTYVPKSVLAGAVLALGAGVFLVLARRNGSES